MKIKICGVTQPEDSERAVRHGATHIGCVMVPDAPRRITPEQAKEVFAEAGKAIQVLVFRAELLEVILASTEVAGTKHVQLHQYDEADAQKLEEAGLTVYRVFEVPSGSNMLPLMAPTPSLEQPAMLDVAGGTSDVTFPWEILGSEAPPSTFISGGVRPENVCALLTHHPYGIDISTGLEITSGIKDPDRMTMFFDTIARAST